MTCNNNETKKSMSQLKQQGQLAIVRPIPLQKIFLVWCLFECFKILLSLNGWTCTYHDDLYRQLQDLYSSGLCICIVCLNSLLVVWLRPRRCFSSLISEFVTILYINVYIAAVEGMCVLVLKPIDYHIKLLNVVML